MSGRKTSRRAFSLIEVVVSIGIIAFALISILGLMSVSMVTHQDSSNDAVFSIMTETALQDVRNVLVPSVSQANAANYNFSRIAPSGAASPYTGTFTGYLYFDEDGQITMDAYHAMSLLGVALTYGAVTKSASATPSADIGSVLSGAVTNSSDAGNPSVPLTAAANPTAASLPTATYYTCTITTRQPIIATGATPNMYLVQLKFTWPNPANTHSRIIWSSISNTGN